MAHLVRAFAAWSWAVSVTGTAIMLAPHLPWVVAQHVVRRIEDAQADR